MSDWLLGLGLVIIFVLCLMWGPLASEAGEAEDRARGYVPLYKRIENNKREREIREQNQRMEKDGKSSLSEM